MEKTVIVRALATSGYKYSFELTEYQAFQILNARAGKVIILNDEPETLTIHDSEVIVHHRKVTQHGSTVGKNEDLDRQSVVRAVEGLIANKAWSRRDEEI
jgi:hypothetical protein